MKKLLLPVALAFAAACAQAADVKQLMQKDLPDFPGKEAVVLKVEYLAGAQDMVHRHDAHAFVYVLEGTIEMQLKGSDPVIVRAGETFYEGPKDIHLVGRNASKTEPARFVVVLIKNKGAPVLTPVK